MRGRFRRFGRFGRLGYLAFFLVFLLPLSAAAAHAATNDIDVAKQALRDEAWEIARAYAGKAAAAGSTNEARLVILESLASEDRWKDVKAALDGWPDAKGADFDYYRAVIGGNHAAAAEILRSRSSPEGLVAAKLFEADSLAWAGRRDAAVAIWRDVCAATNLGERALATASVNLMEAAPLRRAYSEMRSAKLRRLVGLRLGRVLVGDAATAAEGAKLIRDIVRDAPDADGAREAFLALADAELSAERWKEAETALSEAIEIWPDAAKSAAVQEGRGWVLHKLGRNEDALEAFHLAAELATNDLARATAATKEGDMLAALGRDDKATEKYREVMRKYPKTEAAEKLKRVVEIRELEARGRELYREYRFDAALKTFEKVAAADPARRPRMEFFSVLCLYGEGLDEAAGRRAGALLKECPDREVRAEATLWLAKFRFNRREWKDAGRLFADCAAEFDDGAKAADALLWAARAAFAGSDFQEAIRLSTQLAAKRPPEALLAQALLVQGEALIELARFDEAVLVLERAAAAETAQAGDRLRAQTLRADALYAMGADNPARYTAALDAYRAILFGDILTPSARLVVSFKIARALEKLKRMKEAVDQYYTQVVLAYRDGRRAKVRYDDDARAAFSRAAFRLADEYEGGGDDNAALHVLELVADSDIHAAEEARRRIAKITSKGRFL